MFYLIDRAYLMGIFSNRPAIALFSETSGQIKARFICQDKARPKLMLEIGIVNVLLDQTPEGSKRFTVGDLRNSLGPPLIIGKAQLDYPGLLYTNCFALRIAQRLNNRPSFKYE